MKQSIQYVLPPLFYLINPLSNQGQQVLEKPRSAPIGRTFIWQFVPETRRHFIGTSVQEQNQAGISAVIQGLRNYKQIPLATKIKSNWVAENMRFYKASGKLVEKYDVINTAAAKGGEYLNQDGFGWTNGVLLKLLTEK